jgi:hypothetical protein
MVSGNLRPVSILNFRTLVLFFCSRYIMINFIPHSGSSGCRSLGSGRLFKMTSSALQQEKADAFGAAFNPMVWWECRSQAAPFLNEAKTQVRADLQPLFDEAIRHYTAASENLQKVSTLFPCFNISPEQRVANVKNKELCRQAIAYLQAAKEADDAGLKSLKKIAAKL